MCCIVCVVKGEDSPRSTAQQWVCVCVSAVCTQNYRLGKWSGMMGLWGKQATDIVCVCVCNRVCERVSVECSTQAF